MAPALAMAAFVLAAFACAGSAHADQAAILQAKLAGLRDSLAASAFRRPVHLESSQAGDRVAGSVYTLLDNAFVPVAAALAGAAEWCDILMLHLNTKYCRAADGAGASSLDVAIGRKHDQPLDEAYRVVFVHRVTANTTQYLEVELAADTGPLGTRDYRIVLQAVPVAGGGTFLRLAYSYTSGIVAGLAMQAYLGTAGRDKVGFTVTGTQADGMPRYIDGMRGLVERNTMRYSIAVEAFLGALAEPPPARFEKRLRDWYAGTERYPRQLHEIERDAYLEMKRGERARQRTGSLSSGRRAGVEAPVFDNVRTRGGGPVILGSSLRSPSP